MADTVQQLINFCDKDSLQNNLSFMGLFIGMYEQFIDMVVDRVETFLCDGCRIDENGKFKYIHSAKYSKLIKQRVVDEKGNKNVLKASMMWFQDQGAISADDYARFLEIKGKRDSYVHNMSDHILNGLDDSNVPYLMDLHDLFYKIDNWWINEFEIPMATECYPDPRDRAGAKSLALTCYEMMLNVLYGDKSEAYMQEINQTISNRKR